MMLDTDDLVPDAVARADGLLRVSGILAVRRPDHEPTARRHADVRRWHGRFTTRHQEWADAPNRIARIEARMSMGTCLGAMERETVGSACSALSTGSRDAGRELVDEMITETAGG